MTYPPDDMETLTLPRLAQRSVLADEVYEILREHLITGRIKPGTHLNLDRLAREMHVSNTPARQALARLEADGLVTKEPFRGFFASPILDSTSVAELYEFRLMIEPAIAGRGASRATPEAVEQLHTLCADALALTSSEAGDSASRLGKADMDFHLAVAALTGNSVILDHLGTLLTQMSRYTLYQRPQAARDAWDEHQSVVAAIGSADATLAHDAMRNHLRNGYHRSIGVSNARP